MIKVTNIIVSPATLELKAGEWYYDLNAVALPLNSDVRSVRWSSKNPAIACVNTNTGYVYAKNPGTTKIYATAKDGSGVHGHCEVTVKSESTGIKTIKLCRVRKEMSMNDSAILKDSNGQEIRLKVGDIVPLLDGSKISYNNRMWYRILYNGMIMHVTADDNSFEECEANMPEAPTGTTIRVNTRGNSSLVVRNVPNDNDDIPDIGCFSDNSTITLVNNTPQNGKWYAVYGQLQNGNYSYGWCSGSYLEEYVRYGILTDNDNWRLRLSPDYGADSYKTVKRGELVEIIDEVIVNNEYWYRVIYDGSEGYVPKFDKLENKDNSNTDYENFILIDHWKALVGGNPPVVIDKASNICKEFIRNYEGFCSTVVHDEWGDYTIGYGHKITDADPTYTTISEEKALDIFNNDIAGREKDVLNLSFNRNTLWNQQEYDAFVSCVFNCGALNVGSIMDDIIDGVDPYDAFAKVSYIDGKFSLGIYRRRMDEADIFVKGDYTRENRDGPQG